MRINPSDPLNPQAVAVVERSEILDESRCGETDLAFGALEPGYAGSIRPRAIDDFLELQVLAAI
jgi:hypothetical protein